MLKVALAPGIGDNCWVATKLKSFKALVKEPIQLCIGSSPYHKTLPLLEMFPWVDSCVETKDAPSFSNVYIYPSTSLADCKRYRNFDYIMVPLTHLERGYRLENWLPELETDFFWAKELKITKKSTHPERILLYPSGTHANYNFHNNWWKAKHWQEVINLLNKIDIKPVLVGSNSRSDTDWLKSANLSGDFDNVVGQTTIEEYVALIKEAKAWVGLNSGGGILSAYLGTPTLMFWSDSRYRTGANGLRHEQQRNWLHPLQLSTYRTLSFGSPEMTPERVVEQILELTTGNIAFPIKHL